MSLSPHDARVAPSEVTPGNSSSTSVEALVVKVESTSYSPCKLPNGKMGPRFMASLREQDGDEKEYNLVSWGETATRLSEELGIGDIVCISGASFKEGNPEFGGGREIHLTHASTVQKCVRIDS